VDEAFEFRPEQAWGLAVNGVFILLLAGAGGLGVWQAANAGVGPVFLIYLAPMILALIIVPLLLYGAYALLTASYKLERDGIRLHWGLRQEEIPMTEVIWVHPDTDLTKPLPAPWLRWPGAVLGTRQIPETRWAEDEEGKPTEVEYLASHSNGLILIGTERRVYAISPARPEDFLIAFQRCTELGSLTPLAPRSAHATLLLNRVWSARPARWLVLTSTLLSVALLAWVSAAIPSRDSIPLGFYPDGRPGDPAPAVRLLLLPVVNAFFVVGDLLAGLFFFRRPNNQHLAYLLWGGGILTPVLFLIAVFFILRV